MITYFPILMRSCWPVIAQITTYGMVGNCYDAHIVSWHYWGRCTCERYLTTF